MEWTERLVAGDGLLGLVGPVDRVVDQRHDRVGVVRGDPVEIRGDDLDGRDLAASVPTRRRVPLTSC